MNILLIEPMKEPREVQIEPGLESLQKAVQGDINVSYPFDDNVALIVNDEGNLEGLSLNRALRDEDGEIYTILAGNILIVGLGEKNFTDLSPALMQKYKSQFKDPEKFIRLNGRLIALKCPVRQESKRKPVRHSYDMER